MQATHSLISYADKKAFYGELSREIAALADSVWFTALSNAAASLNQHIPDLNWVGFYLLKDDQLTLGPFQGLIACTRIKIGKGVCGTAAKEGRSILVPDVDAFPGHIACDSASKSEIVIPLYRDREKKDLFGVLDLDSPLLSRFDEDDLRGLELVAETLCSLNQFPRSF